VPASGTLGLNGIGNNAPAHAGLQLITFDNGPQLVTAAHGVVQRGINYTTALQSAFGRRSGSIDRVSAQQSGAAAQDGGAHH
jgi:hypothetical protein